jgi:hypothetical protein
MRTRDILGQGKRMCNISDHGLHFGLIQAKPRRFDRAARFASWRSALSGRAGVPVLSCRRESESRGATASCDASGEIEP